MKRRALVALLLIIGTLGCTKEKREIVADATKGAAKTVADRFESSVPIVDRRATREELERERFGAEWRRLRSFRAAVARRKAAAALQAPKINFIVDPKFGESFKGFDPAGLQNLPVRVPIKGDVAGPSVLRAQVLLDRIGYSVGAIDGRWGKNSEIAVYFFQRENNIDATGDIDQRTFEALAATAQNPPALVRYAVTAEDVKGPFTKIPEDVYDKEKLECLCYESLGEKLAEKSHSTVELLASLNPGTDLDSLQAGQQITVANVRPLLVQDIGPDVMKIVVSVRGNYLHGLDGEGNILFHAPTTVGGKYDPSPSETVTLQNIKHDPHFHYQPKLFHEVPDSNPEAHLQPGPNSPVGVVWMALSKPHYGIHGTNEPDTIGYASSHGCVRLANWDANDLSRRSKYGIDVAFVDTKGEPAEDAGT